MARTKDPTAATLKSWETRRRNQEKAAGVRTPSQDSSGGGVVQGRGDWQVSHDYNPTGGFSREGMDRLRTHEADHKDDAKEQAMLLTAKGTRIFETKGARHSVKFSKEESDKMRGAVLTHNHPGLTMKNGITVSAGLSKADLLLALSGGLREIRATSEDGTLYRLGFSKGNPAWPEESREWLREAAAPLYGEWGRIHRASARRVGDKIRGGRMTADEANEGYPEELHEVWTLFADLYANEGVYYKRTRGGKNA